MRKFLLPLLAIAGLCGALFVWRSTNTTPPQTQPFAEPAASPFSSFVSASGLIESSTANLAIAAPTTGIITRVYVKAGQRVRRGDPLFQIDDALKLAEIERQQVAVELAERKLHKLTLGTRPEQLATQQAQLDQARVALEDARRQLELRQRITDRRAISEDEILQQSANVRLKQQQYDHALRELDLLRAGSWAPDLDIARIELSSARAQLAQLRVEHSRLLVHAPAAGEILQVNVHPGELTPTAGGAQAPILMGETGQLHIRAEVDENDAWRVDAARPAIASPRGRRDVRVPLRCVRIEPYIKPKRNLTGDSAERVDTRVLNIVYEFTTAQSGLFVGQQMDVYIEASPLKGS